MGFTVWTEKGKRSFKILIMLALGLLVGQRSFAQVAGGTILGTVSDPSGGVVGNAKVTITDLATGVARAITTNSAGFYSAPNLLPGKYEIAVIAPGFSEKKATGITLSVGAQQTFDLSLSVEKKAESVEVAGTAPVLDLTTSSISASVEGNDIRELPLNGRDWTQLATLEPGVNSIRNQANVGSNGSSDATKATRGFGNQLSVSGTRSSQNNYRLDGISFNDYTNDSPGGVLGTLSGVDAIAEFSVLTTNYSAEYGKTSGGVINAITLSGTNQFHGDVYEFLRNSALDARNFFDGPSIPPFKRNQFGGAFGGPVQKDKTFFFFDYERVRQLLTVTQVSTVPSQNARNGILSTGNVTVDPAVAPYLAFWPLPNDGLLPGGDTGLYSVPTLQDGTQNFYTARIDHKFSGTDSLSGTFLLDQTSLTQPDQLNNEHFQNKNSRPFVSLEETHIVNSRFVNSVRFGFNRNYAVTATADPINALAGQTSLGSVPGRPAASIGVPGLSTFLGGLGAFPYFTFGWNSFQVYDDAFVTRGKHSLKFGFGLERMQSNNFFKISQNGGFSFSSLSDFLTNQPHRFSTYVGTPTPRGIRETLAAGYIQDDWRWRSNLTFNLGLRYEATTVPTEVNGKLSTLLSVTDTQVHTGDPYFSNPTLKDFEPRIGFAWDPFHTGKTSVRGGFGLYDVLPLPYEFLILSSNADAPFSQNTSISAGSSSTANLQLGDFPTNAYNKAIAQFTPGSLLTQRVAYIQQNPSRSYVEQWNLNVQREIAPHIVGTLAYVGSHGVHLPFRTDDSDIVIPIKTSAGYLWPSPIGSGTQLSPNVGRIDRLDWTADSFYHSLQASAKITPLRGVQLLTSYTWGKSIDTSSATIGGDQYTNSPSSLPVWFDPRTRRGVSDFNLGQNLVVSGTWQIPGDHSIEGIRGWAVNGWQLGAILEASSGAPFTVLIGGDPLGLNNTDPFAYPSRLTGAGCSSPVNPGNPNNYIKLQCFTLPQPTPAIAAQCVPFAAATTAGTCSNLLGNAGRNTLTGPGLLNTDFSIFKNSRVPRISENFNVQFRAEFFNIFNRTNFAAPLDNNTIFNQDGSPVGNAGVLTATTTTSRQIQFGLKVIF